jgi:hypothetical protein
MDGNHHLSNTYMDRWATHQVTGARRTSPAQMAYGFEPLRESLSLFSLLQAATVPQSVTCRHVATLNGLCRLPMCAVQARPDMESARTRGRHGFDVRLVVIRHDLVGRDTVAFDGLAKERLSTGGVAALT